MAEVTILNQRDLQTLVPLDLDAIECVEQAFLALAAGNVVMPPIMRLDIKDANGEIDVKTAFVPGLDSLAIKMSPGFFDNPKIGLPSTNGMMVVLSAKTGLLEALLLDNGYLTDVRTAAAGAVAAKYLSRPDSRSVAIIGAGMQARLQLEAVCLVRPIERAIVWARDGGRAGRFAQLASAELGIPVTVADAPRSAVDGADIIVTTTPASSPLIMADWLVPGQHLTAMGSDAEHKNEIDPQAIPRADLYVADNLVQTRRLGELHHAIDAGLVSNDDAFSELGSVVAGEQDGRTDDNQITFADLTGTGVQDTAIATLARRRAETNGAGTLFST